MEDDFEYDVATLATSIWSSDAIGSVHRVRKLLGLETGHERWSRIVEADWRQWVSELLIKLDTEMKGRNASVDELPTFMDLKVRLDAIEAAFEKAGDDKKRDLLSRMVLHSLRPEFHIEQGFDPKPFRDVVEISAGQLAILIALGQSSGQRLKTLKQTYGVEARYHVRRLFDHDLVYLRNAGTGMPIDSEYGWTEGAYEARLTVYGGALYRLLSARPEPAESPE